MPAARVLCFPADDVCHVSGACLFAVPNSVLFLGRPGVGKTTVIREMARVLADDLRKRVVRVPVCLCAPDKSRTWYGPMLEGL